MSPATVKVEIRGLERLQRRLDEAGRKRLSDEMRAATGTSVLLVEAEAKERVPQKSRALFRSIAGTALSTPGGTIRGVVKAGGEGVAYARFVEFGTKPHVILPRRKRALRWRIPGGRGFRFARRVQHPGTKPQPYMIPALDASRARIAKIFRKHADELLEWVAKR